MSSENAKKDEPQIERGFNDDELADIMSEIESLEKDFNQELDFESSEDIKEEEIVQASSNEKDSMDEIKESFEEKNQEPAALEESFEENEPIIQEKEVAKEIEKEEPVQVKEETPKEEFQFSKEKEHHDNTVKSEILEEFKVEKVEHIKHKPHSNDYEDDLHHSKYELPVKNNFFNGVSELNQSKMSFKVAGDLRMELDFEVGSELISFKIENNQFKIKLSSGLEMSLPLDSEKIKKAS